ncbi:MAG: hypothetical protein VZQ84_00995 [Anaerovoracaceae bacterium]|nr:hypothetical protein [Anaerovoracaceae bacterium]
MKRIFTEILQEKDNFIFVGEAGSGKTEIAVNFALALLPLTDKEIHFFDMDQTKPLFRSRDVRGMLEEKGIVFHYEEQFADAPTMVGGVNEALADPGRIAILDVGGNDTGSKLIGGFSGWANAPRTMTYFVINSYRPWSREIGEIDVTLTAVLWAAHIGLENTAVISNPNLGRTTTAEEAAEGEKKTAAMLSGLLDISFVCARNEIAAEVAEETGQPVFPLEIYMSHEWD